MLRVNPNNTSLADFDNYPREDKPPPPLLVNITMRMRMRNKITQNITKYHNGDENKKTKYHKIS